MGKQELVKKDRLSQHIALAQPVFVLSGRESGLPLFPH
jgi:hypothetical protein